jgi:GSH-dependent disulfide-bond oxidoreductase
MIDLYTWTTPNGRKVSILLEELGVPYEVHPVDLAAKAQFSSEFTRISPNNRIPAIVDREADFALMESGAIMMYLAEKYERFALKGFDGWRMIEWLMWQMGGLGPMLGQVHHFLKYNSGRAPYAEERYRKEAHRLYDTLNRRLDGRDYVAGVRRGEYSIADMAIWPWVSRFGWQQIDLNAYPAVRGGTCGSLSGRRCSVATTCPNSSMRCRCLEREVHEPVRRLTPQPRVDNAMVKALARTFRWRTSVW